MALKRITIRIEEEILEKLAFIADHEVRSINGQITVLIRENIKKFEESQGTIDGTLQPELNVKPTRKN